MLKRQRAVASTAASRKSAFVEKSAVVPFLNCLATIWISERLPLFVVKSPLTGFHLPTLNIEGILELRKLSLKGCLTTVIMPWAVPRYARSNPCETWRFAVVPERPRSQMFGCTLVGTSHMTCRELWELVI